MNTTETLKKAYESGIAPHDWANSRDELNYACDYYAVRPRMTHEEAIEHADKQAEKFGGQVLARETEQPQQPQQRSPTFKSRIEALSDRDRYTADCEWVLRGGALADYNKQEAIERGLSYEQWIALVDRRTK